MITSVRRMSRGQARGLCGFVACSSSWSAWSGASSRVLGGGDGRPCPMVHQKHSFISRRLVAIASPAIASPAGGPRRSRGSGRASRGRPRCRACGRRSGCSGGCLSRSGSRARDLAGGLDFRRCGADDSGHREFSLSGLRVGRLGVTALSRPFFLGSRTSRLDILMIRDCLPIVNRIYVKHPRLDIIG